MMRNKVSEPCLCGDPYCPRCFPNQYDWEDYEDADEAYDAERQRKIDEEKRNGSK